MWLVSWTNGSGSSNASLMNEGEPAKPLSRTERRKLERQKREERSRSQTTKVGRLWQSAKKRGLDALTIVGGIAALWSFFPAFSVSRDPPLNPSDVLSGLFLIRYESPIPVADVDPFCAINRFENAQRGRVTGGMSIHDPALHILIMWQGDTITVPCSAVDTFIMGPLTTADITIQIQFRPILIPKFLHLRPSERDFRFVTVKQSDGSLRWVPEPKNYTPQISN